MTSRRQEVWGKPISHSLSPVLHQAAYGALGLEWEYRAVQVGNEELSDSFATLDPVVGGLSLTMPLKESLLDLVSDHRGPVDLLHAANTAVRGEDGWWLDNTDWWGARQAIEHFGGVASQRVWLLGAGATARSILFALSGMQPSEVVTVVRSAERAVVNTVLAHTLSLPHRVVEFEQLAAESSPQWVMSTIPGGSFDALSLVRDTAGPATLFDVTYRPWPSELASAWSGGRTPANLGLWMLSYQALAQVRAFVGGDTEKELPDEAVVFSKMCAAVGLPSGMEE